jgi:hypothetical protein
MVQMTPSNIKLDVSNPNCEYFDGYRINFALCYFFFIGKNQDRNKIYKMYSLC